MYVKRYVNGKPVSKTEFKSLEIHSKAASAILKNAASRISSEYEIYKK